MPQTQNPQFIWVPPDRSNMGWDIIIDGQSVLNSVLSAKFTRGLIGQEMGCEIEIDNSGNTWSFSQGDIVQFKMGYSGSSTVQWEGELEELKKKDNYGFTLLIRGSHYTAKLLDITVTETFTNADCSTILSSIISTYLSGFTSNNVTTSGVTTSITWDGKFFFDCVFDLMQIADFDCYVDNDKDFHFFQKNSIENENEALVWNDALFQVEGLGTDSIDVKNKISVQGEAGGLPVLYTSEDSSSQGSYGTKELPIVDKSITDITQAQSISSATVDQQKNPPTKGTTTSYFMEAVNPGDKIWVVYPPLNVQEAIRNVMYTFNYPDITQQVTFSKETSIPQIFKDRIKKEKSQERPANPYKMKYSYNFTFDDETNIDTAASSTNISFADGKVIIPAGSTLYTNSQTSPVTATQAQLRVIGENLQEAVFSIAASQAASLQTVSSDVLVNFTTTGNKIRAAIQNNGSSDISIDSLAILYR